MKEKKTGTIQGPLFIVFEGIDGSGKSTQAEMLFRYLDSEPLPVVKLAEPTEGPWGKKIRSILKSGTPPHPDEQIRLFLLDREDDARNNIGPALEKGAIIIMDRYYFSNVAYQGAGGVPPRDILKKNLDSGFPRPDRVYFIDIDPDLALRRISVRNAGRRGELFEKKAFLSEVRDIFLSMADETFLIVDGSSSPETVFSIIKNDLETRYRT